MRFSSLDDKDWALGELFTLFERAWLCGRLPHELDPELFHDCWTLLNALPFKEAKHYFDRLMAILRRKGSPNRGDERHRRYEYVLPH